MEPTEFTPADDYTEKPTFVAPSSQYVYPVRSLLSGLIHPAADELPSNPLRSSNLNALDSLFDPSTPKTESQEVASGERRLVNDRSSVNFSSDASSTINKSDGSRLCLPSSTQMKRGT